MTGEGEQFMASQTALGQAIEGSVAGGINTLTSCGSGMFIMFLVTAVSVAFNFYLLRSLITVVKDGIVTLTALKEAINAISDGED
jgi:hypothetical protein